MHSEYKSYRSLELLCRHQAKLSDTPETRKELERMALEYKRLADRLEHHSAEARPEIEEAADWSGLNTPGGGEGLVGFPT